VWNTPKKKCRLGELILRGTVEVSFSGFLEAQNTNNKQKPQKTKKKKKKHTKNKTVTQEILTQLGWWHKRTAREVEAEDEALFDVRILLPRRGESDKPA